MPLRPFWLERLRRSTTRLAEPRGQALGASLGIALSLLPPFLASCFSPPLEPGRPLGRTAHGPRPPEIHGFELKAGEALTVRVEQRGADVEATLLDPQGREIAFADSQFRTHGTEILHGVAERSGRHRLVLRLLQYDAPVGRYDILLEAPRQATLRDRQRARATRYARQGILAEAKDPARALEHFRQGAALLDPEAGVLRAGMLFRAGRMAHRLAVSTGDRRRWLEEERRLYREGLESGGAVEKAYLRYDLGVVEAELGRPQEALEHWSRCSREARSFADRSLAAKALNERGVLYLDVSRPRLALQELVRARELWPYREDPRGFAKVNLNLGRLYQLQGLYQPAEAHFADAFEVARQLRDGDLAVDALSSLMMVAADPAKAEEWVTEARSYEASPAAQLLLALRWGARLLDEERLAEARVELERALSLAARQGEEERLWNLRALLARLRDREGEKEEALRDFGEALRYYQRHGNLYGIISTLYGRAQAFRDLGRLSAARRESDRALGFAEAFRLEAGSPALRQAVLETIRGLYDLGIDLRMAAGESAQAFELAEQARARTLFDFLVGRKFRNRPVPQDLADRFQEVKRQIRETDHRIELALLGAPVRGEEEMGRLFVELLQLQTRMELYQDPRGQSLLTERPMGVAEIQGQLDEGTVLLVYKLGQERSTGWVVSSSGLVGRSLGPRKEIERLAAAAYEAIRLAPLDSFAPPDFELQELTRGLLGPFAEEIRGKHLVVLADGGLTHFPFGYLPDPDDATRSLIDRHDISYAPSASVGVLLNRSARARSWPPRSLAVLADAVYDSGDLRLRKVRRGKSAAMSPGTAATERRSSVLAGLERLHHSGEEARAIAPSFETRIFEGFEAKPSVVFDGELNGFDALHFAAHGRADRTEPALSGIFLSQFDARGRRQDGLVRSLDVYDLDLRASLVVLSACETGLGEVVEGEGISGLVRSFFYAGVPRVVASLWSVDDGATAALMTRFHRDIRRGLPAAAALRAAQRSVRDHPSRKWRAPYYWAGFVLQGAWR